MKEDPSKDASLKLPFCASSSQAILPSGPRQLLSAMCQRMEELGFILVVTSSVSCSVSDSSEGNVFEH